MWMRRIGRGGGGLLSGALLGVSMLFAVSSAVQAKWPEKPVKIVVGFAPGGTSDVTARVLGEAVGRIIGQTVLVENKPGAAGAIAASTVANADPDGHTLLVAPDSSVYEPLLRKSAGPGFALSHAPIMLLTSQPLVVVVNPSVGVKTLAEMVALVKASPEPLPYATASAVGSQRIVAETFFKLAGLRMTNIPYKGGGQAVQDILSGQVNIGLLGSAPVMPQVPTGRLKVLAVSSLERSPSLPDVPTIAESGYPGFDMPQWFGLMAPKATPAGIIDQVAKAFGQALSDPGVRQRLANAALEPMGGSPADFRKRVGAESEVWGKAAKEFGIYLQ